MQAAETLVDKGNAFVRRAEKQLIVVAVQISIEMRELRRGEVRVVGREVFGIDDVLEATQQALELDGPGLVGLEEVAPELDSLTILDLLCMVIRGSIIGGRRRAGGCWGWCYNGGRVWAWRWWR